MPFEKGISGNTNGRPQGASNRTTGELKEFILAFIVENKTAIDAAFEKVHPGQKLEFIGKLMRMVLPRQAVDFCNTGEGKTITVEFGGNPNRQQTKIDGKTELLDQ